MRLTKEQEFRFTVTQFLRVQKHVSEISSIKRWFYRYSIFKSTKTRSQGEERDGVFYRYSIFKSTKTLTRKKQNQKKFYRYSIFKSTKT